MTLTIEIDDALKERMDTLLEDDESYEELIEELLSIYEQSRFLQEGYSE